MIGCILEGLNVCNVAQSLQNVSVMFSSLSCTKLKRTDIAEHNAAMNYKSVSILFVVIGLIPAMIAYYKGHNFWKWWMFGTVLFVAALPTVIFLKPVRDQETQVEVNGMKKCLYCAEMIRAETIVCQFCGHNLVVSSELAKPVGIASMFGNFRVGNIQKEDLFQGMVFVTIVFLIFAMVMLMLSNLKY
jgi:hypothetical protein